MAKKRNPNQTSDVQVNSFYKGLDKDSDPLFVKEGMWTHARNAVNYTHKGNLGGLANEESNALCVQVGTTMQAPGPVYIIGQIYLFNDKWIIFSVGYNGADEVPVNSEIGLFESDQCRYRPIVQDTCLNFNKLNLITGASKLTDDCTWTVYWADNLNPDRYLNIGDPKTWPSSDYVWLGGGPGSTSVNYYSNGVDTQFLWPNVPWNQIPDPNNEDPGCVINIDTNTLNCDALRLATLVRTPCIDINLSQQPGVIENGSYAIVSAYVIDRQRVTNYFSSTYTQPIYNTPNERGSLEITVDADSEHFDEIELVLVRFIDQNLSAKRIGYFSTRSTTLVIDQVSEQAETVAIADLVLQNPVFEKSEQITELNNYLIKIGPTSKFDFNYQPLANLIRSEWVCVEYPEDYYINGGKNTSYLRDEVYAFFIRWVYDTGDKSASYHIPGRAPALYSINGTQVLDTDPYNDNAVGINTLPGDSIHLFKSVNTASVISTATSTLPDGGVQVARGSMGYWQSTEIYPDNQPEVWNSSYYCWTQSTSSDYDLCGKPIRHHRFPDNALASQTHHFVKKTDGKYYIRLMGVQFKNIILPKDNDGNDIPGIVGYEILRGSRHGNKSILAKGMINNFRDYNIRGSAQQDGLTGLYANHPFNTITPTLNSNISSSANYLHNDPFIIKRDQNNNIDNQSIPRDIISFHSPDTSFINPYLSTSELKLYGSLRGTAEQRFIEPDKHPKFKLLTNNVVLYALVYGLVEALLNGIGEVKINYPAGNYTRPIYPITLNGSTIPPAGALLTPTPATGGDYDITATTTAGITSNAFTAGLNAYLAAGGLVLEGLGLLPGGITDLGTIFQTSNTAFVNTGNITLPNYEKTFKGSDILPSWAQTALNLLSSGGQLLFYFVNGAQAAVDILYSVIRKRQYALELIGHGEYSSFQAPLTNFDRRFIMENGQYVNDQIQELPEYIDNLGNLKRFRINNLKRPKLAVLRVKRGNGINDGPHYILSGTNSNDPSVDQSLMTLGYATKTFNDLFDFDDNGFVGWKDSTKTNNFINPIASHYVGIKYRIDNQYGQLENIQQIVATPCEQKLNFNLTGTSPNGISTTSFGSTCGVINFTQKKTSSPVFFGGDTYVNRFTEKNIMPFFYNWLYDVPDNTEFNYFLNQMIPEPKFQVNSQPWDISDFNLTNIIDWFDTSNPQYGEGLLPSSYYNLDSKYFIESLNITINPPNFLRLAVKRSYFYLASCGIRDFFVESEVLVDFRDRGTFPWQTPYSKYNYTDLESLFNANPDVLAKGNYYAYDYTLSAARFLFNQYFTAGYLQARTYDPQVAELCFVTYPNRIMYTLQQNEDSAGDAWLVQLPLNKVDFKSQVNTLKSFAKTGAILTFKNDSPIVYQGVDTLKLDDSGTKITVGDGGLFNQAGQNVVVAEKQYEYGSAQNKYGVISTPAGIYYISQNQGKIFSFNNGLKEISQIGLKWWFAEFLPFKLLEDFPDYPYTDNPVAGIACSASYDNNNGMLYFSKIDYQLKEEFKDQLQYNSDTNTFSLLNSDSKRKIKLGDNRYFKDASWTASFDPKQEFWVSFHDWHPGFYMPNRGVFHTVKQDKIWEHEANCNDYCNFYGVQYPFQIEFPVVTIQNVSTVRSLEYYLECYRREQNLCVDTFHVLDYNFDRAVVYNSEQVSGYLNLNIYPKNDIGLSLSFPKLNPTQDAYDVLFSKEENKYRINQFWDITKDRGEFPIGSTYPPGAGPYEPYPNTTVLTGPYEERNIWITEPNGYVKSLNSTNLDYQKAQLQRKKFRHYINYINLSKSNSRDTNMIVKIFNTKTLSSPR